MTLKSSFKSAIKDKTWKREIALVLTGFLCYAIYGGDVAMVEAIIWPILAYVGAASGLHIYKQTTLTRQEDIDVYRKEG